MTPWQTVAGCALRAATPDLAELALTAARAGADAVRAAARGPVAVSYKGGAATDPVTGADHSSEHAIRRLIATHRGADAVLAEESGHTPGTTGLRWVIDPLDGTVNFSHGLDRYAVSVAIETVDGTRTVGAAIVRPACGGWLALGPGGAGGSLGPVRVSTVADPARALLAFAVPNQPAARAAAYGLLVGLAPRVQDLRNFGSTVCDLAAVATGELDGFVTVDPAPWDLAAGLALVRAAGGAVRRHQRTDGHTVVVAGTPAVTDAVADWLTG